MIRRQLVGAGIVLGIIGGIVLNTYLFDRPVHLVYAGQPEQPREIRIGVLVDWTAERIDQEIDEQAKLYGRNPAYMKALINCESHGSTTVQSKLRYTFSDARRGIVKGQQERSYGLAQIHLPDHPQVSEEEAKDPAFAIAFMAKNLGKVKWYCEDMI